MRCGPALGQPCGDSCATRLRAPARLELGLAAIEQRAGGRNSYKLLDAVYIVMAS